MCHFHCNFYYTKKYTENYNIFDPTFYKENMSLGNMEKKDALEKNIIEAVYEDPQWMQKLMQLWEQSKQKEVQQYARN